MIVLVGGESKTLQLTTPRPHPFFFLIVFFSSILFKYVFFFYSVAFFFNYICNVLFISSFALFFFFLTLCLFLASGEFGIDRIMSVLLETTFLNKNKQQTNKQTNENFTGSLFILRLQLRWTSWDSISSGFMTHLAHLS